MVLGIGTFVVSVNSAPPHFERPVLGAMVVVIVPADALDNLVAIVPGFIKPLVR